MCVKMVCEDCILCKSPLDNPGDVVCVSRGLNSLINASELRRDGLDQHLKHYLEDNVALKIHISCRRSYTRPTTIEKDCRRSKDDELTVKEAVHGLRSSTPGFDMKVDCIFCGSKACVRTEKKKELKYRRVIHEVASITEFRKTVIRRAQERNDDWGTAVKNRLECVIDPVAGEAKYHHDCYLRFFSPGQQHSKENLRTAGRPEDEGKKEAFDKLCDYINDSRDSQFSSTELEDYYKSLLSADEKEGYSRKHLMNKIIEHFQGRLSVTELNGKQSIFRLKETADAILHNKWYTERKTDEDAEERVRVVEAAAAIIREEIRDRLYDTSTYPSADGSSMASEDIIPEILNIFLKKLIVSKSKQGDNVSRRVAAIGQAIVSSCRPRTFVSPLLLGIGVSLHVQHGSRELVDLLHSFSFSASYKEVKRYQSSLMEHSGREDQPTEPGYIHFAFDNADWNVRTLTGHGTFHSLGGVSFTTPASSRRTGPIQRNLQPCSRKDIASKGVTSISWYKKRAHGLQDICAEDLRFSEDLTSRVKTAAAHNVLWIAGRWAFLPVVPAWNGFMRKSMKTGEIYLPMPTTRVSAVPFINLPPSDPSAIYSALKFAQAECVKRGQGSCLVTFDQPLYNKASDIVAASPPGELDLVTVRLGGFHLLMSFMGSIGYIMSGSGLEDLWELIYAKTSVQHMTSGHAYSRALRAHFLTQEALASILLSSEPNLLDIQEKSHLESMCRAALEAKLAQPDIFNDHVVRKIMEFINDKMKSLSEESRTAKLWAQYYEQVEIIRLFIRAERTSDWNLHLFSVSQMMPYLHAAGHIHYAKSTHLYVQEMMKLDERMPLSEYMHFTEKGAFSIRRTEEFWAGVWSDMAIEQDLMRPMKSRGGLTRGRGVDDCALAHFVSAFPLCIPICEAVEEVSGIKAESSEQHVELRDSRRKVENRHSGMLRSWLEDRSPWDSSRDCLQSLSTGLVADESVNCDKARDVGEKAMKAMVGKSFGSLKVARKGRVVPLSAVACKLKVRDDIVPVNPHQLFMRIICVMKSEEDIKEFLKYELAPTPPALFDWTLLRKTAKSALQDLFESSEGGLEDPGKIVIDGGLLMHAVVWPKPATFGKIIQSYKSYIANHYPHNPCIVFDGYGDTPSTKNQEQARRAGKRTSVDIIFDSNTIVSTSQADFLSNPKNKERFISALASELTSAGVKVHRAPGDADALIVDVALSLDSEGHAVTVVASDTDVLCLLLAKARANNSIAFYSPGNTKTPGKIFSVRSIQEDIGEMKSCVLFAHAVSGCDTTSAIFGKGKKRPWNLLKNNEDLRKTVEIFNQSGTSKDGIAAAGERFFLQLYNGSGFNCLNDLRVHLYGRTVARQTLTASFDLATLPPTSDACRQHSLRTYLQVQEWQGNRLEPTEWGWRSTSTVLQPIPMTTPPAPDSLLKLVSCDCKSTCASSCDCLRSGLKCSWMCGKCRGVTCENVSRELIQEQDPDDFDVAVEL